MELPRKLPESLLRSTYATVLIGSLVRLPHPHSLRVMHSRLSLDHRLPERSKHATWFKSTGDQLLPLPAGPAPFCFLVSCFTSCGTALGLSHASHPRPQPIAFLPSPASCSSDCGILTLMPCQCQSPDQMHVLSYFFLMPHSEEAEVPISVATDQPGSYRYASKRQSCKLNLDSVNITSGVPPSRDTAGISRRVRVGTCAPRTQQCCRSTLSLRGVSVGDATSLLRLL